MIAYVEDRMHNYNSRTIIKAVLYFTDYNDFDL